MRVLFLTHYFPPEGNAPASRTYEHAKRWVEQGVDVTVVTGNPNVPHGRLYPGYRNRLRQVEYIDGIRVIRMWTYLAANAGSIRRILNYLSFMVTGIIGGLTADRPDVVVATSPQFFCGWAGVLLSRIKRLPFVLEIRDIWPDSIAAVGAINQRGILGLLTTLERLMYRAANHIVTVGDGYREALLERSVPTEKITVIPNGADLDRFRLPADEESEASKSNATEPLRCLYIGTVGMASRLDLLIDAAERLKQKGDSRFEFIVVGDGADRERLEAKAKRLGLSQVLFTGLVPKSQVPTYIDRADICLVHLRRDPLFETVLPSKLFEAMAKKKPIILGVRGSAAEVLQQADAGIAITPESTDELLEALEDLYQSPSLRKELGTNGRAFVTARYNRDHFAQQYLEQVLNPMRQTGTVL